MKKFSEKYYDLIHEDLEAKFGEKIDQEYISLKRGLLDLIEKSINTDELVDVQNFINGFIENPDEGKLEEFVEDGDIFNFYLKYQTDIDDICNDNDFFNDSPVSINVFSLYDYVIEGTKFGVVECMKILEQEMFQE